MSLGWQGESALLPKRAKAINVDNTSMQMLRAEVLDEKQRRDSRQKADVGRLRKQRGLSGSRRRENQERHDIFSRENRGVHERESKDRKEYVDDKKKREDKVTSALKAKAKLYDQLQQQGTGENFEELQSGALACEDVLVDFGKKRTQSSEPLPQALHLELDDYSDIEDEFGRHRRLLRSSEEYQSYRLKKRKSSELLNDNKDFSSPGHPLTFYEEKIRSAQEFVNGVKREINETCEHEGKERERQGGGVRSQWEEKVLRGEERSHLLSVHEHTTKMRKLFQEQQVSQVSSADGGHVKSDDGKMKVLSATEKRRNLIRQKQMEIKNRS